MKKTNRPSLISLSSNEGRRIYAVVTGLNAEEAALDIGGREIKAKTSEITPLWSGDHLALWKPPPAINRHLQLGMRGKDVVWLRKRLSEIGGDSVTSRNPDIFDGKLPDIFDDKLKENVIAFQKDRSLAADGIVGTMTLIHLNTMTKNPNIPVLN